MRGKEYSEKQERGPTLKSRIELFDFIPEERRALRCPAEALSIGENGKGETGREHGDGCGICRSRCESDAPSIKQTVREDLPAYFLKDFSLDIKLGKRRRGIYLSLIGIMSPKAAKYYNRIDIGFFLCIPEICLAEKGVVTERELLSDEIAFGENFVALYRMK